MVRPGGEDLGMWRLGLARRRPDSPELVLVRDGVARLHGRPRTELAGDGGTPSLGPNLGPFGSNLGGADPAIRVVSGALGAPGSPPLGYGVAEAPDPKALFWVLHIRLAGASCSWYIAF